MIHRIRKRDLFPYAGETIITPKQISELLGSDKNHLEDSIKRQLITIIRQQQRNQNEGDDVVVVEEEDIFCQIVQIGYGKGNLNPVSHLTTFYAPNKEFRGLESNTNQEWRVGVIPEGNTYPICTPYVLRF